MSAEPKSNEPSSGLVSLIHDALCPLRKGHGACEWPTDHSRTVYDAAEAVKAAGWVSPEEHQAAVYDEHEKHIDAIKRAEKAERERDAWREVARRYGPPEEDLLEEVGEHLAEPERDEEGGK